MAHGQHAPFGFHKAQGVRPKVRSGQPTHQAVGGGYIGAAQLAIDGAEVGPGFGGRQIRPQVVQNLVAGQGNAPVQGKILGQAAGDGAGPVAIGDKTAVSHQPKVAQQLDLQGRWR